MPFILCAIIGAVSWHGNMFWLATIPLLFMLWGRAANRYHAYFLAVSYYLGCAYPLIKGAAVFFQNPLTNTPSIAAGIAIWIIASLLLALPWGICRGGGYTTLRIAAIIIAISLPPLGIFGWGNPLTAAGTLFPGYGWWGLILTFALFVVCTYGLRYYSALLIIIALSITANITYHPTPLPGGWVAINTELGWLDNDRDDYRHHQQLIALANKHMRPDTKVILFPEMVTGNWTENSQWLWKDTIRKAKDNHTTILLGTTITEKTGQYSNALIGLGVTTPLLLDRVPVPISMWKPWTQNGAASYFFHNGIYHVASKTVATLICYEQLLVWPVLHSMVYEPDVLIGAANDWWAKGTVIPAVQQEALYSWGRLFGVGILSAVNW
jgi:hypothetical protein